MSGDSHRIQKVEKELREIIATYIVRHFTSSMLGVTQVNVTADLRTAKVFLTAMGQPLIDEQKLKDVQSHAFAIQKEISAKLRMRYCPKIKFVKDEGTAASVKVDEILNKIKS
jgi:ribosome-binding factor A